MARSSPQRFLGFSALTLLLLSIHEAQLSFMPPSLGTHEVLTRRGGVAAAVAAVLGLTSGAEESGARAPWEPKKYIYATFTFDMEGDSKPGENVKSVVVRLDPEWAPIGVRHFLGLVETGDFDDAAVFNVSPGKLAYFGLPAEPLPDYTPIKDDLPRAKNTRGKLAFIPEEGNRDDRRTNQLVFHLQDVQKHDYQQVQPIGEVIGDGMKVIDQVYSGYGRRPLAHVVKKQGNKYLDSEFPKLTKIKSVTISESSEEVKTRGV